MHAIFVALDAEEITTLPDHILHQRWSYNATSTMATTLKSSTVANRHLRQLVGSAARTVAKTNFPSSFLVRNHSRRRVEFKKLKRNERAGDRVLVQSDVEKHNIVLSTLTSIIRDMEQSSSDIFFKKLAMVEVACKGLSQAFKRMSTSASNDEPSETVQLQEYSDSDSTAETIVVGDELDISLVAHIDSDDEFLELEKTINTPYKNADRFQYEGVHVADTNDGSDDNNAADAKNTADHHALKPQRGKDDEAIGSTNGDEIGTHGEVNGDGQHNRDGNGVGCFFDGVDHPPLTEDATTQLPVAQSKTTRPTRTPEKKKALKDTHPQLTQMTLPPSMHSSRSNSRKRNSTKKLKHPRVSVEVTTEEYGNGVPIADVVAWLERSIDHDKITKVFSVYPVVRNKASDGMCKVIVDAEKTEGSVASVGVVFGFAAVTNALTTLRTDLRLSKLVIPRPRYALQLFPDRTPYHESVLWTMQEFYRLKSDHKLHVKAMAWLERDWTCEQFQTDCFSVTEVLESKIADAIKSQLRLISLSSYISFAGTTGIPTSVTITELIGTLPNRDWVKDSPISVILQIACRRHGRAVFVESTVVELGRWKMPNDPGKEVDFVVTPCNSVNLHWTLVIIDVRASKALIYDPLDNDSWTRKARSRAQDVIIPVVNDWRILKFGKEEEFPRWRTTKLVGPIQPDSINCGIYIAAMSWAFLANEQGWLNQRGEMPTHAGATLRLKMLYHLLCAPEVRIIVPESQAVINVTKTEKLLSEMIKAKTKKPQKK